MYKPRMHFICRVYDVEGNEDILDVLSLDDVPCCWILCTVLRTEMI